LPDEYHHVFLFPRLNASIRIYQLVRVHDVRSHRSVVIPRKKGN
jgi:hypothetical protein